VKSKESTTEKEYILKTWGEEYDQLALNEYFCLKAVEKTGVPIPKTILSSKNKFLLVERFNFDRKNNRYFGFEEILSLLGKNKEEKYSGSYEKVAETIRNITTETQDSMRDFFKIIVMNYLLKNGDAHLKNFGILYTQNDGNGFNVRLAPAYDIVNTVVYSHKDKPALTMFGKKLWYGKKELIKFGVNYCSLNEKEAADIYGLCINCLKESVNDLTDYLKTNVDFINVGKKMLNIWRISLDEKTYKEIPHEFA
ncbi:MAG: HipA domain-containing protein, partial [Candidatus Riflebacteria bacterium]|nr:HipA domain-containing protein [Candidatus Riflebacteria bacterium]